MGDEVFQDEYFHALGFIILCVVAYNLEIANFSANENKDVSDIEIRATKSFFLHNADDFEEIIRENEDYI